MWILPKQLLITFRSALDMKASDSDLEGSSRMFERYVWWRGKLSTSATWFTRCKRENWIKHLFGLILERSLLESFVDWWTSSVGASPVNPLAIIQSASQTETNDTCTPSSKMELENVDLPLFSWKTSRASLPQKQVRENLFSGMSLEAWNRWTTSVRQEYSQRVKLEHPITEEEYSFFPTPDVAQAQKVSNRPNYGQLGLANHPHVHGSFVQREKSKKDRKGEEKLFHPHHEALKRNGKDYGLLNADWVEQMMGLPTGWTDFGHLGQELSHKQQSEPLESSQKN
jgi:hypothetical protein